MDIILTVIVWAFFLILSAAVVCFQFRPEYWFGGAEKWKPFWRLALIGFLALMPFVNVATAILVAVAQPAEAEKVVKLK